VGFAHRAIHMASGMGLNTRSKIVPGKRVLGRSIGSEVCAIAQEYIVRVEKIKISQHYPRTWHVPCAIAQVGRDVEQRHGNSLGL
jgi:hypothetical protein